MSPRAIQVSGTVFGVLGIIGVCMGADTRPVGWFCLFVALMVQVWDGMRSGVISSNLGFGGYSFTHRREETPLIFMWAVVVQSVLAVVFLFAFLLSL